MRKLLILVLVSITAFLGVNLTKVSTYASTTPGITYVVDGERTYIHFGNATNSNHYTDLSVAYTTFSGADLYFDFQMSGATTYKYLVYPSGNEQLKVLRSYQYDYKIYHDGSGYYEYIGDVDNIENSVGSGYFYFTNETLGVSHVIDENRSYVHFNNMMAGMPGTQSFSSQPLSEHFIDNQLYSTRLPYSVDDGEVYIMAPENATKLVILQTASASTTYVSYEFVIQDNDHNARLWAIEYSGIPLLYNDFYGVDTSLDDQGYVFYFELELSSPITYVTEGNRTYVEYYGERNLNQDTFTANPIMTFEAPSNALSLHVIDMELTEDQEVLNFVYDFTDLVMEINWTTLWFETVDDVDDLINEQLDDSTFQIYFTIELPPIAAEYGELKIVGNRAYLVFNDYPIIDVTKLQSTSSTLYELALPEDVIGLYIADEFGSVIFDWNNTGHDLDLPDINGYDNLFINTSASGFYMDVEGQLPNFPTQIFVSYEEGLFAYGVEGYTKFQIYFELTPFENSVPIITGDTIVINIDNPLPEATLRAEISAWDDLDGDITADLVYVGGTYESARLAGTLVVGNTYTIIYSVEDSSGNITQATINVEVVDITKPLFGITNTTTQISYTQTLNLESFKANLLATDNYDDTEDLVINILTDNYTANKLVPGSYTVVYRVIDTSTNYRDITITVEVIDNVGPVITGPNNFNVPLSPKTNISIILQQFTASDAIDGNVTTSIEVLSDAYTAASTPGIYSVTIRFSDSSGNTTNKTFTITMADGVPPILFITSGLLIGVNELQTLTVEQIITLLEAQGNITGFTVLSNTYAGNENTPGTYQMVVAYTQNEVQYQHTLSILVTPSQLLQWTVSFITNGGSNLASIIVNDLGQLLIQAPSRTGYRFVGWYKDAELTQPFSMVTGRITNDTTLYAKWVPVGTAGPSIIIDNISNLKLADILIIVGTIAVGIGVGFYVANKKKPTSKRKRG